MPVALIRKHQIQNLGACAIKELIPSFPKIKYTIKKCGAEISSPVEWKKWIPGMEYTRCIVIKNLLMKIQKFTFELPETKFFLTAYPKTITLSTGTCFYLPVTFHPLEDREYKDKIKFSSNEGTFFVELLGLLPKQDIKLPKSVILPVCSVFSQTISQLKLKNVGEVPIEVRWSSTEPFEVQCSEDMLAPEQSHEVTIIFKPKAARKYEGDLVCKFGTELKKWKILKAVAQGKYPHLKISAPDLGLSYEESPEGTQANIDFGIVPIGETVKKNITIENLSYANVAFKIEFLKSPSKTSYTNVFLLPEKSGVVLPMSNFNIPIHFTPDVVNSPIIEYFCVVPHGHISQNVIKCVGYSEGPKVYFRHTHINFQIVNLGSTASRKCLIENNSQVTITYEFLIDNENSVFSLDKSYGYVFAKSTEKITIEFTPQSPIAYYRKLICLVHNQEPILLDLLGTCHSSLIEPYFLAHKHIRSYEYKVRQGFGAYPPDQLNELVERHVTEIDASGKIVVPQYPLAERKDPLEMFFTSNPTTEHYTVKATGSVITVDTHNVNFGRHLGLNDAVEKEIAITNHSRGKVVTQWTKGSNCAFTVIPLSIEIPSNKSATLKVIFTPNQPHLFYESELECFVYFKCLRNFHIAKDNTMCPPFCITIQCSGNTYPVQHQMFVPQHTIQDSLAVRFPSVNLQSSGYKTLVISNNGSTPLLYQFDKDPNGILRVKPSRGLITTGHKICILKFSPQEIKKYYEEIKMTINNSQKFWQILTVHGWCEEQAVQLNDDKKVYFKPTCIGTKSEVLYSFKNLTGKVLYYDWHWKHNDNEIIEVCSKSGRVLGNESQSSRFIFSPRVVGKRTLLLTLFIWPEECLRTRENSRHYEIKLVGFGTIGELTVEPAYANFGEVVVGCTAQRDILLYNEKNCDIHCKLLIKQTMDGIELPFEKCTAIQISEEEIIMGVKSKQILNVVVVPPAQGTFQFHISYKLLLNEDVIKDPSVIECKHLCHLLMTGVYPLVTITDIQGRQSAKGIRKRQLWSSFSIECFNSYLHSDPSYQELNFSTESQKTTDKYPKFETEAVVDFDFAAAALGSPSSDFTIKFQNNSIIPTEWDFLFPDDLTMEMEPWSDTGPADAEELSLQKILEENIFTVNPKKGVTQPGESVDVTLCFHHTLLGTFHLPVLFKVKHGREILINFVGVTVEVNRPYIHFNSLQHTFSPMPIGIEFQPKQIYEMYNGGGVTVNYTVDTQPLTLLKMLNYNYPVLVCNNPIGTIEPSGTAILEWIFSPLETKTYSVDVPIYLEDGETVLVNFVGVGYDANSMGDATPYSAICDALTPEKQLIKLPDQFVFLSHEKITFGNVPLFSMSRRILFANNHSSERNATLEWHLSNAADEKIITVIPKRYFLRPNESMLFKIIFLDRTSPAFYEIQLVCKITDETEVRRYKVELRQWLLEQERQRSEFNITENNLEVQTPDLDKDELYVNSKRLQRLLKPLHNLPDDLKKYGTLPPIGQNRESKYLTTKSYSTSETILWKKPLMPACLELPISITAHTLSPDEYEIHYEKVYRSFMINRTHYISSSTSSEVDTNNVKATKHNENKGIPMIQCEHSTSCLGMEKDTASRIITDILRSLLRNTYFIESLHLMKNEKVYYYQQFVSITPRSTANNSQAVATSPYHEDGKNTKRNYVDTEILKNHETKVVRDAESQMQLPHDQRLKTTYSKPLLPEFFADSKLEVKNKVSQALEHVVEFNNFVEVFIEGCIFGVMDEAMRRKFNITAPSRFVALPKKPDSCNEKLSFQADNPLIEQPTDISQPVSR